MGGAKPKTWRWPEPTTIEVRDLAESEHNRTLRIASRSGRAADFQVNLYKLTCTCPNFRNNRAAFSARDVRRICPHIHQALIESGAFREFTDVTQLVVEHGRAFWKFHRFRDPFHQTTIVFGFNNSEDLAADPAVASRVGVYAVIADDRVAALYDLAADDWVEPPPTKHEPLLRAKLREAFVLK